MRVTSELRSVGQGLKRNISPGRQIRDPHITPTHRTCLNLSAYLLHTDSLTCHLSNTDTRSETSLSECLPLTDPGKHNISPTRVKDKHSPAVIL